jgi:hypothetical protein
LPKSKAMHSKDTPIDATWTDVPQSGAECTAIVPQSRSERAEQVYQALPVHKQSQAAWGQIQRASTEELRAVYEAHVVVNHNHDNRVTNYYEEHHHHHHPPAVIPPSEPPARVEFIPMPYPVVEYRDAPQQQQPINIYNIVETSSHGGNAHAHARSESEDWGSGRHVLAAIFFALAMVALVGAIAGE